MSDHLDAPPLASETTDARAAAPSDGLRECRRMSADPLTAEELTRLRSQVARSGPDAPLVFSTWTLRLLATIDAIRINGDWPLPLDIVGYQARPEDMERSAARFPLASETTDAGLREVERALRNAYGDVADVWPHFAAVRAALASETTDAGLLLKLLAESDIATTTYNDVRRVLVAVCAAYDRTVAKPTPEPNAEADAARLQATQNFLDHYAPAREGDTMTTERRTIIGAITDKTAIVRIPVPANSELDIGVDWEFVGWEDEVSMVERATVTKP